jgi:hypothetical protein
MNQDSEKPQPSPADDLTTSLELPHDQDGKIIPTDAALIQVVRAYPDRSDAELYRLAQAQTVCDLFNKSNGE